MLNLRSNGVLEELRILKGRSFGSILLPTPPKTAQLAAKIAQDSPTWTQHGPLDLIFFDVASICAKIDEKSMQKSFKIGSKKRCKNKKPKLWKCAQRLGENQIFEVTLDPKSIKNRSEIQKNRLRTDLRKSCQPLSKNALKMNDLASKTTQVEGQVGSKIAARCYPRASSQKERKRD